MRLHKLRRRQFVPAPLAEVFRFFSRPENLEAITPPELGFKILTPSPVPMRRGALIDYAVSPFGVPMRWSSLITEFEAPRLFVDEQLKGPYSYWRHAHRFEPAGDGTWIEDDILYALPFGPLGVLAHFAVRKQLEGIFDHRARFIADRFANGATRR